MTVVVNIRDKHGNLIELNQRVALKVQRRGGLGNWWQQKNKHHFDYYWLPGIFKVGGRWTSSEIVHIYFSPDLEAEKSLEQPMGQEREEQSVDHLNVDVNNPENLDACDVPAPGTWRKAEE